MKQYISTFVVPSCQLVPTPPLYEIATDLHEVSSCPISTSPSTNKSIKELFPLPVTLITAITMSSGLWWDHYWALTRQQRAGTTLVLIQTLLVPHCRPSSQLKFNVLEQTATCYLLNQVKRSSNVNWNEATTDHARSSKRQATTLLHHCISRWHETNSSRNIIMDSMSLAWEMQDPLSSLHVTTTTGSDSIIEMGDDKVAASLE